MNYKLLTDGLLFLFPPKKLEQCKDLLNISEKVQAAASLNFHLRLSIQINELFTLAQPEPIATAQGDIGDMVWSPASRILYYTVPGSGLIEAADPIRGSTFSLASRRQNPTQMSLTTDKYDESFEF